MKRLVSALVLALAVLVLCGASSVYAASWTYYYTQGCSFGSVTLVAQATSNADGSGLHAVGASASVNAPGYNVGYSPAPYAEDAGNNTIRASVGVHLYRQGIQYHAMTAFLIGSAFGHTDGTGNCGVY